MVGMCARETGVPQVEEPKMGDIVMIVTPTRLNRENGLFAEFEDLAQVLSPGAMSALVISGFIGKEWEYDFAVTLLTGENKGHVYGVYRDEIAVVHGYIRTLTTSLTSAQIKLHDRYEREPASCRR